MNRDAPRPKLLEGRMYQLDTSVLDEVAFGVARPISCSAPQMYQSDGQLLAFRSRNHNVS